MPTASGAFAGKRFDGDYQVIGDCNAQMQHSLNTEIDTNDQKLTPNQDLQCYFFEPSAIAALSRTSATGFTVSGTWRQQFDWAVMEWNRDNVFEHPALRNLPDGDLSGITLSYQETRTNCIAMDSDLFHTVSWPFLRVWAPDETGTEQVYQVPLDELCDGGCGEATAASARFHAVGDIDGRGFCRDRISRELDHVSSGRLGGVGCSGFGAILLAAYSSDPFRKRRHAER